MTASSCVCGSCRTPRLSLDDVHAHVEVNCNLDMEIDCASIDGRVDVNQLSSTSRITVPKDVPIAVLTHGLRTRTIVGAGVRQDEDSPTSSSSTAWRAS